MQNCMVLDSLESDDVHFLFDGTKKNKYAGDMSSLEDLPLSFIKHGKKLLYGQKKKF